MSLKHVVLAVCVAACGDDGGHEPLPDAGPAADAGPSGALRVVIDGPSVALLEEETCFTAVHDGGAEALLTWIWGDETREESRGEARACHRWPYPGEVLVSVVVRARGMTASDTRTVTVVPAPSVPAPASSSSIAYDVARDRVWVVNPDADTVAVIDAVATELVREIAVGDRPRTVAIAGDVVAVACQEDASIRWLDADTLAEIARTALPAGSEPYGVVADPRGTHVYVSLLATGRVLSIDRATRVVAGGVDVGLDARGLAVNADGLMLVTRWRAQMDGARVTTVDVGDPAAPSIVGAPAVLAPSVGVDSDTDNDGVPNWLNQVVWSPDGARALIPALKANVVTGMFRTGTALTSQTTARAMLVEVMLRAAERAAAEESFRFSLDDLDHASALVFSPQGDRVYVAIQGAEVILALDPFAFNVAGSIDDVGFAPQGLAISPDGRRLFVQAYLSREVRVYDVSDLSTEPAPLATIGTVASEPLSEQVLLGARVFHRSRDPRMSRTSYLSCASCHLDGEGDNLVWDFTQRGEGLRNTIPLRGHVDGAIHWTANFDEVQDFEHDIRVGQGGAGFIPDRIFHFGSRDQTLGDSKVGLSEELDALDAFVRSLGGVGVSPWRRTGDAAFEASVARGRAVFEGAFCTGCHDGPALSDSGFEMGEPRLHDVNTAGAGSGMRLGEPLRGLDTPSLRGLWRSAPYLHDGSAATLREALIDRNPDDWHGRTSILDEGQIEDLINYLMSLDG